MASIYDLSKRDIYQLKSIDPQLSAGWQKTLFNILPKIDKPSQRAVFQRILAPRGVFYDKNKKQLCAERPKTLEQVYVTSHIDNTEMHRVISHMQTIIQPTDKPVSAEYLSNKLESVLSEFEMTTLGEDNKLQVKYEIRKAFLYDLARWIDTIEIEVSPNMRCLNQQIVKAYIKEVFIKQQLQGLEFCSWNPVDIQGISNIPDWIKESAKRRHFFVVETPQYWFLIGQTYESEKDLFSLRRFLYEDVQQHDQHARLSHVVVPRLLLNNPKIVQLMQLCVTRFYVLNNSVSEIVSGFIRDIKHHQISLLRPLLREPLSQNENYDIEKVVYKRLIDYEKQLTIMVLKKLPRVIETVFNRPKDQDYLFYHLHGFLKQLIEDIEDFRLQPATKYSVSAESLVLRMTTYTLLLKKIRKILCSPRATASQITNEVTNPLKILQTQIEKTEEGLREVESLKQELQDYKEPEENLSLWQRIRQSKMPEYTLTEVIEEQNKITEDLFLSLVHLEKQKRDLMVYLERELYQAFDGNYRHYAFANDVMGIASLPKLVRLPEDKKLFHINTIRSAVYFDLFKLGHD